MPAIAGAKANRESVANWFQSLGLSPEQLKPRCLPGVRVTLSCRNPKGGASFRHVYQSKTAFERKAIEQAIFDAEFNNKLIVNCVLITED